MNFSGEVAQSRKLKKRVGKSEEKIAKKAGLALIKEPRVLKQAQPVQPRMKGKGSASKPANSHSKHDQSEIL